MAQRNPLNERYQGDSKSGKTRKSAAKAKPKKEPATPTRGRQVGNLSAREEAERKREEKQLKRRMAADAQRSKTKEERKADREKDTQQRPAPVVPTTPEYRKWKKIWWIALVVAIIGLGVNLLVMKFLPNSNVARAVGLIVAYGGIFAALFIDLRKLRPQRILAQKEAAEAMKSTKKRRELEERVEAEEALLAQKKSKRKTKKKASTDEQNEASENENE